MGEILTARANGSSSDFFRAASRKVGHAKPAVVSDEVAAVSQIKSWLERHAVEFSEPIAIPMSFIDEKKSRANQARRDALIGESVDRYTTAYRQGAVFPPIVGYYVAGKFVIIDGNHRQAAAKKANHDSIMGILISQETPSEIITLLTIEANSFHGKGPDDEWRIEQALQMLGQGFDLRQAAASLAISTQTITNAKAAREADQRARAMKINGFSELHKTSKHLLNALTDEPIFFQAASIAVRTEMTSQEVRDFVREIKLRRSEGMKLDYMGQVADDRKTRAAVSKALGKARRNVQSPTHSLSSASGKLLKIEPELLARTILTATDRDNAKRYLEDVGNKCLDLLSALDARTDLDD